MQKIKMHFSSLAGMIVMIRKKSKLLFCWVGPPKLKYGSKSKMTSAVHEDDASVNIRLAVLHHLMIYNNVWVKSGNIYRKCLIMILMYQSILFEMPSQGSC